MHGVAHTIVGPILNYPIPMVDPILIAEPIYMVDPILIAEPIYMVDPIPMVDPLPMVDPTPMVDPIPMVEPLPRVDHIPIKYKVHTKQSPLTNPNYALKNCLRHRSIDQASFRTFTAKKTLAVRSRARPWRQS